MTKANYDLFRSVEELMAVSGKVMHLPDELAKLNDANDQVINFMKILYKFFKPS